MPQAKEDLEVWNRAMQLAVTVYRVTQNFPASEAYGLTSQVRRAAVSVASNIAEGRGRLSEGEFRHFLGMAQGSNYEVQTQLLLAFELAFGRPQDIKQAQTLSEEVGRMLNGLLSRLQANGQRLKANG